MSAGGFNEGTIEQDNSKKSPSLTNKQVSGKIAE